MSSQQKTNKASVVLFTILSLLIFSLFITYFFFSHFFYSSKDLPILGKVPPFNLTSSTNQAFSNNQLLNKVWVTNFIFTTCSGPCPVMSTQMSYLYRSYLLENNVDFVSFTVNPDYDSPEVLSSYAQKYNADPKRWHFLTGQKESIHNLAYDGFKLGSKDNPIVHSTNLILVDQDLQIRGYYDGTDKKQVKQIFKDIAKLI